MTPLAGIAGIMVASRMRRPQILELLWEQHDAARLKDIHVGRKPLSSMRRVTPKND